MEFRADPPFLSLFFFPRTNLVIFIPELECSDQIPFTRFIYKSYKQLHKHAGKCPVVSTSAGTEAAGQPEVPRHCPQGEGGGRVHPAGGERVSGAPGLPSYNSSRIGYCETGKKKTGPALARCSAHVKSIVMDVDG